jgi:protein-disulfide isomerase
VPLVGLAARRRALTLLAAVVAVPLLAGGSCRKGEAPEDDARRVQLPDLPEEPAGGEKKPVEGAKLDALKPEDRTRFEALVDQLPSPCGKAHSLRTSRNTDAACGRARFAVEFVEALLTDGAADDEIKELYMARYPRERKKVALAVDPSMPHAGPGVARVVFVEFFDYGCPACGKVAPELTALEAAYPQDVVVYYKMFPLAAHPDSAGAAQAALAAHAQGKFKEMHALLFADQFAHQRDKLDGYAKQIGLDMKRFAADFDAVVPKLEADKAEGNRVGVQGTPTIFLNGVLWEGPPAMKYMKMWVDEELALNR